MATKKNKSNEETPILELSSESKPRRHIQINGTAYKMRWREEFGFQEQLKFQRRVSKLQLVASMKPEAFAELSDKVIKDTEFAVNRLVKTILIGVDDEVLDDLTFDQKMQILAVFIPAKESADETPESETKSDSTSGTQPYRISKDSSEEAGETG